MNNRIKTLSRLCLISIIVMNSCAIHGNFEGLYSYYDRVKSKNPSLLIKPNINSSICKLKNVDTPHIYVINGASFKECADKYDSAVVYIWSPKCKSKFCYPLTLLQKECNNKKVELFIVAEYYDNEFMELDYHLNRPIFGIDTEYYNTNLTSKYRSKFLYDITSKNDIAGRFIYFKKGSFIKSFNSIEEI